MKEWEKKKQKKKERSTIITERIIHQIQLAPDVSLSGKTEGKIIATSLLRVRWYYIQVTNMLPIAENFL